MIRGFTEIADERARFSSDRAGYVAGILAPHLRLRELSSPAGGPSGWRYTSFFSPNLYTPAAPTDR